MSALGAIAIHVAAGATWVIATLAIAVTGRAARPLLIILLSAALATLLAGIYLWHVLHAGRPGPREHLLAVGTFCAFIALGLQLPVAIPMRAHANKVRLVGRVLAVYRITAALLACAAVAMVGSLYV